MRHTVVRAAGVSPYAQALKHIALRGATGLQRTAAEDEQAMYRAGTLPMDYRPPKDSAWDDTMERWAYAWQYPISEHKERVTVQVAQETAGLALLTDTIAKLIEAPPSKLPGSAKQSREWPMLETSKTADTPQSQLSDRDMVATALQRTEKDNAIAELAAETFGTPPVAPSSVKPAEVYSQETGIPVAYLDDGSELSQASRAVALVLTDHLGLAYDERGIAITLYAMARNHADPAHMMAIFNFAKDVGLGPTDVQYNALCFGAALQADSERCIALVEDMKERGITPSRHSWLFLARSLHASKDHGGALQVLDNMKALANLEPTQFEYDLRLRCLAHDFDRPGAPYEAVQLFDQMEHVDGIIPTRMLYTSYLAALARSAAAEHRLRVVETGMKMEALGIPWDLAVYKQMLRSAGQTGDLVRVQEICVKLRDEGLELNAGCMGEIITAHARSLYPDIASYTTMEEKKESVLAFILDRVETGMAIFDLGLKRGLAVTSPLLARLLQLHCTAVTVAVDRLKEDERSALVLMEEAARKVWNKAFDDYGVTKDPVAYEHFIKMLGALQRIDEAENIFTELVQERDLKPTRGTYEALIVAHLSSGEEGATARALQYFEAMEKVGHSIRAAAIKRMVQATDDAAYKRDMKRRARRIMQAREEYLVRKAAEEAAASHAEAAASAAAPGVGSTLGVFNGMEAPAAPRPEDPRATRDTADVALLPKDNATTLSWWERWRAASINKHELFDSERADGMPRGEDFREKNAALKLMGIESRLTTPQDVPGREKRSILAKIRETEDSEPAGALWALDGGDTQYPTEASGVNSWAGTFWRERQLVKKELERIRNGNAPPVPFSTVGIGARTSAEQVLIHQTGAKTMGELQDALAHPDHVYDGGKAKGAAEFAVAPSPAADMVWVAETRDKLGAYRSDEETATLAGDNETFEALRRDAAEKTAQAIEAVQNRQENLVSIVGAGSTKKRKYDYLEHFRELYRHGTLEAPDEPLLAVGRDDHKSVMAAHVKGWFDSQRRTPASTARAATSELKQRRNEDAADVRRVQRKHQSKQRKTHRGDNDGKAL